MNSVYLIQFQQIDDWLKKAELLKKKVKETETKLRTCTTSVPVSTVPTQLYIPVNRPSQLTPSPSLSEPQTELGANQNYSLG